MPWSKNDYPDSMKNLPTPTRDKAIEIANALLRDGKDESSAIRIAITKAKENRKNNKQDNNKTAESYESEGLVKLANDFNQLT